MLLTPVWLQPREPTGRGAEWGVMFETSWLFSVDRELVSGGWQQRWREKRKVTFYLEDGIVTSWWLTGCRRWEMERYKRWCSTFWAEQPIRLLEMPLLRSRTRRGGKMCRAKWKPCFDCVLVEKLETSCGPLDIFIWSLEVRSGLESEIKFHVINTEHLFWAKHHARTLSSQRISLKHKTICWKCWE